MFDCHNWQQNVFVKKFACVALPPSSSAADDVDVRKGEIRFGDDIVTLVSVELFFLMIFFFKVEQNLLIPTCRNNSAPRLFLRTGLMYRLVLFLPFTLIFASESYHPTAIYTNTVLSTDCKGITAENDGLSLNAMCWFTTGLFYRNCL